MSFSISVVSKLWQNFPLLRLLSEVYAVSLLKMWLKKEFLEGYLVETY
jgi:hypothetical protein